MVVGLCCQSDRSGRDGADGHAQGRRDRDGDRYHLGTGDLGEVDTLLGGFLATIVTGANLIVVAAVLGLVVEPIIVWYRSQSVSVSKASAKGFQEI
jgi:hypothetical protein